MSLTEQTIQSLTALINREGLSVLPPMHALSRTLGVSIWTLRAAIRQLVDKGQLCCSQGRPIAVVGAPRTPGTTTDQLFELLRQRIVSGEYRVSQPLPKTARLMLEEHVSPNTISAAYARLREQNLIHRIGKRWIAGPSTPVGQARSSRRFRSVILLTPLGWESRNFYTQSLTAPFSRTFVSELHDHGIMLSLAFFEKASSARSAEEGPIPSGINEIRAYVKALGDDYLGTLIYFGWGIPECAPEVVHMLATFGKPIVDFDHGDKHAAFPDGNGMHDTPVWHRCHFDETAAVTVALKTLADRGHRVIGVPVYSSDIYNWVEHRVGLIKAAAAGFGLTIETQEQMEKFWRFESQFDPGRYPDELLAALQDAGMRTNGSVAQRRSLRTLLLNSTPSLTDLLATSGLTALIALNDEMAREIHLWLKFTGKKMPEEISLISFDNIVEYYHMPVSTVDFGFTRLGYQAAHVFIGDIPVRADKSGDLPGVCSVIDKGSVSALRRA